MKNPKNILITGASSGIGRALAIYYAKENVTLYITGRNKMRLDEVVRLCSQKGAVVDSKVIDVTDKKKMSEWVEGLSQIDLVIANAGISGGTGDGVMNGESMEQTRQIFNVNIIGVLNTIEPALSRIHENKPHQNIKGQVAIISSMAGFRGWPSAPAYSASKGCVRFYGEALRGVLRKENIAVNVICPGFVTSRITDANDFAMPMKMEADKAAKIIADGLSKNKGRISFPWPIYFVSWLIGILPDFIAQKILSYAPDKKSL
jgi:short-subunit dehydrogenase